MAMNNAQSGKLFYVIGASGSGKDSLMNFARSRLASVGKIIFAHRYITRPPEVQGENHVYLSNEEFKHRKKQGFFFMHWESHGLCYGIGSEINLWLANGYDVVVNGSRAYLSTALEECPETQVILVSTSTEVLRKRLLKRNRETPEEIEKRLHRATLLCNIEHRQLITLNNDADLAQSGAEFIKILTNFDSREANKPALRPASNPMQIKFLGTGNAPGVPVRGCTCDACIRANTITSYRREPCAALVEIGPAKILIDAGVMDLKKRFPEDTLAAILLTHFHPDHVQGLFSFRWGGREKIDTFCPVDAEGCSDFYKNPGILNFKSLHPFDDFDIAGIRVTTVPLVHSRPTLGYCFEHPSGKLAYLTDTEGLPQKTAAFLCNWKPDLLVLDCSYPPSEQIPRNHNDITMALKFFAEIKPKKMLLTHIGHQLDVWLNNHERELPHGLEIVRDNDVVTLER